MTGTDGGDSAAAGVAAHLTIITTEHYNLQTLRAATISETNGRASIFLGAVSAGLVAIGFSGANGRRGTGFVIFALLVLAALIFLGFVAFVRAVETSIDDVDYILRINRIREAYTEIAPELGVYLESAAADDEGLAAGRRRPSFQLLVSTAGSLAVITSLLAGSAAGLGVYGPAGSLVAALVLGPCVGAGALYSLVRWQRQRWRAAARRLGLSYRGSDSLPPS